MESWLSDKPTNDAIGCSGNFPVEALKTGRMRELENLMKFGAFVEVQELLKGRKACDMVCGG